MTVKSIKKDLLKHEKVIREKIEVVETYLEKLAEQLDKINVPDMNTQKSIISAPLIKSSSFMWEPENAFNNIQESMRRLQNMLIMAQKQFAVHLEHSSGMPGTLCNYMSHRGTVKLTKDFTKTTCPRCRKVVEDSKKFLEGYGLKVE